MTETEGRQENREPGDSCRPQWGPEETRQKRFLIWLSLFGLFCLLALGLWFGSYPNSKSQNNIQSPARVYIAPGTGVRGIQDILHQSGVLRKDIRFLLLTKYLGLSHRLQAGEYRFVPGASPRQILDDLAVGNVLFRSLTIPEGSTIFHVAEILARQGWAEKETVLELIGEPEFIQSLNLSVSTLEGYLFPDTYFYPKGEAVKTMLSRMVMRGREVFRHECVNKLPGVFFDCQVKQEAKAEKGDLVLGHHEVLTLASIIEKETALSRERGLVARVFFNRIQKKMKLQADPTVVYGLQKFDEPLSKFDLQAAGPYNTYMNYGLPPGPISNPGRESIRAVFQPSQGNFYYFVANNNGSHTFSTTLREHNKAVRRFRQLR